MTWELGSGRPIYAQLMEQIQQKILSGEYKPGDKLKSVRDLASEASVNPNTMQKALEKLEEKGLVYSQRTSGRYISENRELFAQMREEIALEQTTEFLKKMYQLGIDTEEIIRIIQEQKARGENRDDTNLRV